MSKSNLEILEEWKCESCLFSDKKRINAMKSDQAVESLGGWCTYAFKIRYSKDFTKCLEHTETE